MKNIFSIATILIASLFATSAYATSFTELVGDYKILNCVATHNSKPRAINYCQYSQFNLSKDLNQANIVRFAFSGSEKDKNLSFGVDLEKLSSPSNNATALYAAPSAQDKSKLVLKKISGQFYRLLMSTDKAGGLSYNFILTLKKTR